MANLDVQIPKSCVYFVDKFELFDFLVLWISKLTQLPTPLSSKFVDFGLTSTPNKLQISIMDDPLLPIALYSITNYINCKLLLAKKHSINFIKVLNC